MCMALNEVGIKFLLYANSIENLDFSSILTIGRQSLIISPRNLHKHLKDWGYASKNTDVFSLFYKDDGYADGVYRLLGAQRIEALDYSDYEGATCIHDMNVPVPDTYKDRYTVVLDGGALEHVFNFPVAIKNCMEMLVEGGYYLGITPSNNYMGHGLYQLSPEIYFRIFQPENGFQLHSVIAVEERPNAEWFLVRDPKEVGKRGFVINHRRILLLVIARKVRTVPIFAKVPQQSDYMAAWKSGSRIGKTLQSSCFRMYLPLWCKDLVKSLIRPTFDPDSFTSFNPYHPNKNTR